MIDWLIGWLIGWLIYGYVENSTAGGTGIASVSQVQVKDLSQGPGTLTMADNSGGVRGPAGNAWVRHTVLSDYCVSHWRKEQGIVPTDSQPHFEGQHTHR